MKKSLLLISVVFALFMGLPKQSSATHFAGCDLTYVCLGGNDYMFTLVFYRDCSGVQIAYPCTLNFTSSCGNFSVGLTAADLEPGYPIEVTPTCPGQTTTCSGGTLYGLQKYMYTRQITMAPCSDWTISFSGSARNTTNNTTQQFNWFVPTFLNNQNAPCNSSPQFSNLPVTVICQGQTFCYNHGAIDPDGDSLVYSLTAPLQSAGTPVGYAGTYSATNPLPSTPPVTIDPVTGDICMTPTQLFNAAIAVKVEEWRWVNGTPIQIGYITRDMQVNVVSCNNFMPTVAGINPAATQYNVNDTIYTLDVCMGDTIDFNIYPHDSNLTQNLTLTWNNGIPGGTFNVTNNNTTNAVGHFFWVPTLGVNSNVPQCFTVNVKDNNCPYIGQQTFSYCITVKGINVKLDPPENTLLCVGEGYQVIAHADSNAVNYYWFIDGAAATPVNDSTFDINSTTLSPGLHTIAVRVDDGTGTICPGFTSLTVNVVPQPHVNLGPDQIVCEGTPVILDAGPGATYSWIPAGSTQTFNVTTSGLYFVTVDGGNGTRCQDTGSVNIRILNKPLVDLGPDICSASDSAVILDAGDPFFPGILQYQWNNGSTNQTLSVPSSGQYSVTISELFGYGCDDVDTINISINPLPALRIITTDLDGNDISSANIEICSHKTLNLTVKDADGYLDSPNYVYTYYWDTPLEKFYTRDISLTCLPEGANNIRAYVTACSVIDTVQLITTKLCALELPNVFTPNGDAHNNTFEIKGIEDFPNSTLQVFNRWGKKIFESENYNNSDNVWTGEKSADGVYYYVLTVNYGEKNTCLEAKNFNGTVTIIR
jgi:gliding motility-associated-like protein